MSCTPTRTGSSGWQRARSGKAIRRSSSSSGSLIAASRSDPIAYEPRLIIQVPRGGAVHRQLTEQPPPSVAGEDVLIEPGATDEQGILEPPIGGEIVLSVPSPEALRKTDDVHRVIARAGTGNEPLVIVVEVA